MKILITILMALFISNSANAQSIKNICWKAKMDIELTQMQIQHSLTTMNNAEPNSIDYKYGAKNYKEHKRTQLESAQLYHYLDCREVLKGDG